MKKEITRKQETIIPTFRIFAKTGMFHDCKTCSFCGQCEILFKKRIRLKCSSQVGDVQYVKNPQEYIESEYIHN